MFFVCDYESCGILALEPAPSAVEGKISTPEKPVKSQATHFYSFMFFFEV